MGDLKQDASGRWAATNTLRESMFVCGCDAGSEGERRQIQQEQDKALAALALVEAALDAAEKLAVWAGPTHATYEVASGHRANDENVEMSCRTLYNLLHAQEALAAVLRAVREGA